MKSKIEIKTQAQAINEMRDALIEFEQTGEINDTMKSSVTNSLRDIQVRDFALGLTFENNSIELVLSFFDYLLLSAKEIETVSINAIRASYLYRLGDTVKAYEALNNATEINPDYSLTMLLRRVFGSGWPAGAFEAMTMQLHPKVVAGIEGGDLLEIK